MQPQVADVAAASTCVSDVSCAAPDVRLLRLLLRIPAQRSVVEIRSALGEGQCEKLASATLMESVALPECAEHQTWPIGDLCLCTVCSRSGCFHLSLEHPFCNCGTLFVPGRPARGIKQLLLLLVGKAAALDCSRQQQTLFLCQQTLLESHKPTPT